MLRSKVGWTIVTVSVCCLVLVLLSGCGGGGGGGAGGPGIPGFSQEGEPYTPPESAMSTKQQVRAVAEEVLCVAAIGEPAGFTSDVSGPWDASEALDAFYNLGVYLEMPGFVEMIGFARCSHSSFNSRRLAVRLTKVWLQHQRITSRRQTQKIDWTDPELGVHWTGTYTATAESISLRATGVDEGTKISINLSGRWTGNQVSLSITIDGTAPEQVYFDGAEEVGIARMWLSYSLSGTQTKGDGKLRSGYETTVSQNGQKIVTEREVYDASLSYMVSGNQITVAIRLESTYSERVGNGLFWVHTQSNVSLKGLTTALGWDMITGTVTANASNGMTARVEFKEDGTVTGWVKDKNSTQVAEVRGNINTQVKLVHADGTEEKLWVWL